MRSIVEMDTVQIEITNACQLDCSNCTRFCGHIQKPFFLSEDQFRQAVDSLVDFPKMVGIMGGEPLLHPSFKEFCEYVLSKIPRERLGLWTAFPKGKEHLAEQIVKTFGNIFLNDHTRDDIYHAPILIGIQEVAKQPQMWTLIDRCWVQNSWSASINPKGAWFCEIAAAMAILFEDGDDVAWKVEPGWWWRSPKDFREQMEASCARCGMAAPLKRRRSIDGPDDISPLNLAALKERSRKIKKDLFICSTGELVQNPEPMASYKDMDYRQSIAARYGMYLTITPQGFWEPHLGEPRRTLFSQYKEKYA